MYTPLDTLPDSAKVWIYQSPKKLTESQKNVINTHLSSFTETWKVHGEELRTSYDIVRDQFVILAADDVASGCSIDSSVRIMRLIADEVGVDFFDRTTIAFLIDNDIVLIPLGSLKEAVGEKRITPDTPVFNNALATLGELRRSWPAPARDSWVSRYFPKESVIK